MRLCLADHDAALASVERGVLAHAGGTAASFPSVSMEGRDASGAIYTIRGVLEEAKLASVKTVGSFPGNRAKGLSPDPGLLTLVDTRTGAPRLVAEASTLTTIRTAAMTALGARVLAKPGARVIGCIGARGIAPLAARMIAKMLDNPRIKLHSRSEKTRTATVADMRSDGLNADAVGTWDTCVEGSDIVIDGAGLRASEPLLKSTLIAPGALVISYGAFCSLDEQIVETMDHIVVDRWDPTPSGAMGRLIGEGRMTEDHVTAFFGDILTGQVKAREAANDRVLFWHRGIGACDIALAADAMARADSEGFGIALKP